MHIGFSISLVSLWNFTGLIVVDNTSINNKLFKLIPITFPITIYDEPFHSDAKLTNNSGNDVPIDTIVKPIIISGI